MGSDDKILMYDGINGNFIDTFVAENNGSLRNPQGLFFTNDHLFVSSYNDRILQYDLQGNFVKEFTASKDTQIIKPVGMAIDKEGNLFTTSQLGHVLKFSKTGLLEKIIPIPDSNNDASKRPPDPHGLFLDDDDNVLYISVFNKNQVLRYDLASDTISEICCDGDLLDGPEGLSFDKINKILYISNNKNDQIIAYNVLTKSFYPIIKNSGDGELSLPRGLFFNDDGILYIANSNNNEILMYDPIKNL